MKRNYLIYALLMTVFLSSNVISAQNYFGDFPVKADPKTVGNKLSRRLMETKHQLYFDRGIHYAEVCTWYGALRFAELTNNKDLIKLLRNRFESVSYTHLDQYDADGNLVKVIYNDDDKVFQGQTAAPVTWALRNDFTLWKDLTLSVNIYSRMGHKSLESMYLNNDDDGGGMTYRLVNKNAKEYWTVDNPVSYTHLDVYKRQSSGIGRRTNALFP